jgi:hypothetical protein
MTPEQTTYAAGTEAFSLDSPGSGLPAAGGQIRRRPGSGLFTHMRNLRRRNRGASRWLAAALLAGTVAALAFVNFFAR